MLESTPPPPNYGTPSRGVAGRDVELAADALLREGQRPTIEKIRQKIGRGSPNTINPLLDAWWKRVASRLDAGPAALHRLPESVAHVAEALWMQALDEGRRRATQELTRDARSTAHAKDDLEVRAHVLTLREREFDTRFRDRDRTQATLEGQVHELTVLIRKDRATIDAQSRRIADLEDQLLARVQRRKIPAPQKRSPDPKRTASPKRAGQLHRPKRPKTARRKKSAARKRRRLSKYGTDVERVVVG
jgi:hypothetical protein